MGNAAANFGKGLWFGVLSLVDPKYANPLEEQRQKISNTKDATQQAINAGTMAALKMGTQMTQDLYNDLHVVQDRLQSFVEYNNELLWESVAQENLFLILLFILVLIILFFNLFVSQK